MNVPSGVRSAIYTAVPLVSAIVIVLSTNPVVTTCVVGLCTGAAILVSWNASARIISDTPISTNESFSSSEDKADDSFMDVVGVVGTERWMNYPSTPTTEPQPLDMSVEKWRDQPSNYWQPPVPGCAISAGEHVLSNDDIRSLSAYGDLIKPSRVSEIPSVVGASRYDRDKIKALEDWCKRAEDHLRNKPEPPPDRSWVTTEFIKEEPIWGRRSNKKPHTTKHTHEFEFEESTYGDAQPTKFCRCGYVAPYEPIYEKGWKR